MLVMLGERLKISYPILLVLAGLGISIIPGMPHVEIEPEIVFLIFLPPLLYEAAWYTSWYEFWKWKRSIILLAFGLVLFTSLIVAFVSSALIPGFTLAMGFLLGGIISPPDAIAATSVLRGLRVPKRVLTILEGESLINDASSLIVFRFALMAILTGQFVLREAAVDFFVVTVMGIAIGVGISFVIFILHRLLKATPSIDTTLTILTPYILYLVAEQFHFSGVMAVVSGGLFMSFRAHRFLNYSSRIQSSSVWSTIVFVFNGVVFILIGLQLPVIVAGLEEYSIGQVIGYGVLISLLTIIIRIVWLFPGAYLPRMLSKKIREEEERPDIRGVFLISWAGMRGVVSLASALSIPLMLNNNMPFPHRNLIMFITFIVILVTLVFQGLSLPYVIRRLKIEEDVDSENGLEQELAIRMKLSKVSVEYMDNKYSRLMVANNLLQRLKIQHENNISMSNEKISQLECVEADRGPLKQYQQVQSELLVLQRQELIKIRSEKTYDDELIRKVEQQLDYDEARLKG